MCLINVFVFDAEKQSLTIGSRVEFADEQVRQRLLAHPRLKKLLDYLELYPSRWLTTAAAARVVCFQKNYFCAFFKRETGCTFVSWQHAWRVTRIAGMLLSEDISITRAAERYGYLNMRAFERAFKSVFQISAREFRREYRTRVGEPRRRSRHNRPTTQCDLNAGPADPECGSPPHLHDGDRTVASGRA
jgi:AraC-like DNA-binding protein